MAYDRRYGDYVRELLDGLGEIRIRPMFGAAGVYQNDLMFGIIDDDVFYLRTDAETQDAFVEAGARQFTYPSKDAQITGTSYWSLPDEAADDPSAAVHWARLGLEAAKRKAAKKRRKPGKP